MVRVPEPPLAPPEHDPAIAGQCLCCGWGLARGVRCYRLRSGLLCEDCADLLLRRLRVLAEEFT